VRFLPNRGVDACSCVVHRRKPRLPGQRIHGSNNKAHSENRQVTSERTSDDEDLLADFLLDWEDSQNTATSKTPDEICGPRSDLVPELKSRIDALKSIDHLIFGRDLDFASRETISDTAAASRGFPTIPGYRILSKIGSGGMGVVFKAVEEGLKRFVAIKIIKSGPLVSEQEIARFHGEAESLADIHHPGVVQIHRILDHDGVLCLVLEFVDGKSLDETSRQSTMAPNQAAKIAQEIAIAVSAVHARKILHRDIKPSNILIDVDGKVNLTQVDLSSLRAIRELIEPRRRQAHQTPILALSTSLSGRFVVSTDSNSVKLWDGVAGSLISSVNVNDEAAKAVVFVPDENHFVIAGRRQVELYENIQHTGWNTHPLNVHQLAAANISRNRQVLVQKGFLVSTHFGPLQVKDLATGIVQESKQSAIEFDEIIDADDGANLIMSETLSTPHLFQVIDLQTGILKNRITCPERPHHLTLHRDRRRLYFAALDATAVGDLKPPSALFVCDWKVGDVNLLWSNSDSQIQFNVSEILAISCGQELLATSAQYNTLRIHRAVDGSVLKTIPVKTSVTSLHMIDDSLLLTGDEQGTIRLLKLPEGTLLDEQSAHTEAISGLVTDDQNQNLVSACRGGEIRFWTLKETIRNGEAPAEPRIGYTPRLAQLPQKTIPFSSRTNHDKGAYIDSTSKTLQLVAAVGPMNGPIKRLALSGDGQTLMVLVDGESGTRTMQLGPIRKGLQSLGLNCREASGMFAPPDN
jgi:WD40 repeat protein